MGLVILGAEEVSTVGTVNVVVLGCYRSGSSLLAGMLHCLGVNLGAPYWGNFYEAADLSAELRVWWDEPRLNATVPPSQRVSYLREWQERHARSAAFVGAKHPLLSLSAEDVLMAWGASTRWIWANRPLDESIASLERLNWWPDSDRVQTTLMQANQAFLRDREHLQVNYLDSLQNAEAQVIRIVDFLGIKPTDSQLRDAVLMVRKNDPKPPDVAESISNVTESVSKVGLQDTREAKIVATMITGSNESIVEDAVQSAIQFVDELILVDTGISDQTKEIVESIAGSKYVLASFPWCNDFAAARNAALQFAESRGATWALTLDSDERIDFSSFADRSELIGGLNSDSSVQTWMVACRDNSYSKERFIRIPTTFRWAGRTHEALVGAAAHERRLLMGCHFWETPKSDASFRYKLERDLAILTEETKSNPANGRWWYYLGQTLELMQRFDEAIVAFEKCVEVETWGEQAAWASYCASRCLIKRERYQEAKAISGVGLTRDIYFPELAWVIGWCHYQQKGYEQAIEWSRIAVSKGCYQGDHSCTRRVGLRHVPAWYELPYDVLRYALRALGREADAVAAEQDFEKARAQRERGQA